MEQIPADILVSEGSIQAGLLAMEQIHGGHLHGMTPEEQAEARAHWRRQVEEVLGAVFQLHSSPPSGDRGRAVITLSDAGEDQIELSVDFQPDLRELGGGEVEGTPAQVLALNALEAIAAQAEADGDEDLER